MVKIKQPWQKIRFCEYLTKSAEIVQLKEELKQEKRKRQTQEILLTKLYQELQKLKVSVHMSKKLQTMEELNEEIADLEAKKEKMDESTKIMMTSTQEGSIVDITMQKLEKYVLLDLDSKTSQAKRQIYYRLL